MPGPLERLTGYSAERIARGASTRAGERLGIDWLTYNPLVMRYYHRLAVADAAAVVDALERVFPDARRWVDVGAGSGAFSAQAQRSGKSVVACEHSRAGRLFARWQGVDSRAFDLTREPPAQLPGPFDLAFCFEVAEHLPPVLGDRLVALLVEQAPRVAFTAAHPGQGGYGHVNEQEQSYWIRRFESRGAALSRDLTDALVSAFVDSGVTAPWLIDNAMVFTSDG